MIAALTPYPQMRDSGVKWLGEVPEHWEVRRVTTVADMRVSNVDKHVKEGEHPVRLCNYIDVYHNGRISADVQFMAGSATRREIQRFRLAVGDVLVTKDSEHWTDIGVPALVEYAADDLVCGYHLAMLRPNRAFLDGRYLFQALRDSLVVWQLHVAATGVTRYGLSQSAIRSIRMPLPPLPEQNAITRFLDDADRRIRRYIRAKERLIDLLEEQKQAIIHRAVTGQIDVRTGQPYQAYKDSGVEWLGEVPEHWGIVRLKSVLERSMRNGLFKTKDKFGSGVPLVNVSDVYRDEFQVDPKTLERVQVSPSEVCRFRVRSGDIFIVRSSLKLEGTGRSAMAVGCSLDTVFECHLVQLRPATERVIARYLVVQLNSPANRHYLVSRANVVTMATVAQNTVASCPVLVPPPAEQEEIVRWVDDHLGRTQTVVARIERESELLRKFRTRLIADVVTGKLDVREAASALPEADPLDADDNRRKPEANKTVGPEPLGPTLQSPPHDH